MTDEKESAGTGSLPPTKIAGTQAVGSSPTPADPVQSLTDAAWELTGRPTVLEQLKKKRGRPKKIVAGKKYDRPKCESFLQTFPHIIKVIYPSTNSPDKMGICVFKKDEMTAGIARFTQNDKGDIYWSCRKIPGPNPFIYDLIEVPAIMIPGLSRAVMDIQQFFGGHEEIVGTYVKAVEGTTELRKEITLSDRAKKYTAL